jgi:hypothetical protein
MARRGRFGRAEAGSSNLSSLIQQLIREQKAAEERLLLESFYSGTALYGSVPTLSDVIDFYKDLADLGGFEENSMEYQALLQKIDAANNFDINREYNRLTDEFELTNGANYDQLVSFLRGRAQSSTNEEHLATYGQAVSDYTFSYLNLKGQVDLKGGAITAEQYRSLAAGLLETIGKDDPNYYNALLTAYTHEWNSENQKYYDRFQAGNISKGQYLAFIKEFQNTAIAAGVSKDSTLYTGTLSAATTARSSGGVGGASPSRKRYDKSVDDISAMWNIMNSTLGFDTGFNVGAAFESRDAVLEKIARTPEAAAMYAAFIEDNPAAISAELRAMGITTGQDFLELWDRDINNLRNNANAAYTTGSLPKNSWQKVGEVWTRTGSATYFEEIQYVGNRYLDDRTTSKSNEFLMDFYDREYEKYLTGKSSYYGQIPEDAPIYHGELIGIELEKLRGNKGALRANGVTTWGLSGSEVDDVNSIVGAAEPTKTAVAEIKSGIKVKSWNEQSQSWNLVDRQSNGVDNAVYQYVRVEKLPDGTYYAYTAVAFGTKVIKADGTPFGAYRYNIPDAFGNNEPTIIGTDGTLYDADYFSQSGDSWMPMGGSSQVPTLGKVSRVDYRAAIYEGYDPTLGLLDRTGVNPTTSPETLIKVRETAEGALIGIRPDDQNDAAEQVAGISGTANELKARRIAEAIGNGSVEDTPEARLEIIELTRGTESQEYRDQLWIVQNQDNLVKTGPYDYRFKSDYQAPPTQGMDPLQSAILGATTGALVGGGIGAFAGPAGIGLGALKGGLEGLATGLGAAGVTALSPNPQFEALAISERLKPEAYKKAQRERVAASPQAQQYQQTGYPAGANMFFRNAKPQVQPASPSGYLGLQATVPMPKSIALPQTPKPINIAIGSPALLGVSGDSLKERRDAVLRATASKAPPVTPRRPGGA